jgi:hypothetical protein
MGNSCSMRYGDMRTANEHAYLTAGRKRELRRTRLKRDVSKLDRKEIIRLC